MLIRQIEGATRSLGAPASWDQGVSKCEALPILDVVTDQGPFMVSAWAPTPEELAALNAGVEIRLWISGTSHPVVALEVAESVPATEHLKGHASFAEMVDGHIHIWREALGLMLLSKGYKRDYVEHEIKALTDIEVACKVELAAKKVEPQERRDAVFAAVEGALGDAMDCTRVWSAWSVGTMSDGDFRLVREDAGRVAEITDAVMAAMNQEAKS